MVHFVYTIFTVFKIIKVRFAIKLEFKNSHIHYQLAHTLSTSTYTINEHIHYQLAHTL